MLVRPFYMQRWNIQGASVRSNHFSRHFDLLPPKSARNGNFTVYYINVNPNPKFFSFTIDLGHVQWFNQKFMLSLKIPLFHDRHLHAICH
jgi:hypothetical protein